jgi:outer membrane protein assembly factor BamB
MNRSVRTLVIVFSGVVWFFACFAADWPTFRGDQCRSGYYPDPVGVPAGKPAWKISLGACEIVSSPVVKDNLLYIGARDSSVYAIDCATGVVRWKVKTKGWVDASALVDGNRVIIGSRDSTIYMLDRLSGNVLGLMHAGVQLSSPALTSAGVVLSGLGLPRGGMCGFNGSALSKTRAAEPSWTIPLPQYTYSSPAIHGQAVVIGATDGRLYGIDAGRRDTVWSLATQGVVYLSTPAIDDTVVYFAPGDEDRNVYAVNLLTGAVVWKNEGSSPSADAVRVLSKNRSVKIVPYKEMVNLLRMSPSFRKQSIQRLREQGIVLPRVPGRRGLGKAAAGGSGSGEFIPLGGMKTSSVAIGRENVFVVQKDLGYILMQDSLTDYRQQFAIKAFNKQSGAPVWSFSDLRKSSQLGYCSSPVVTRNAVYFGWGEGKLYGLDVKSGEKIWEDSVAGNVISSPAIAAGRLYVATMDGNLYAWDLTNTLAGLDFSRSTYCYPNPAPSAVKGELVSHIQVFVAADADLDLVVFNAAEKAVFRVNTKLTALQGKYTFNWDLRGVANGVYLCMVKVKYATGRSESKVLKIAVLK